jgi:hypothetical protein
MGNTQQSDFMSSGPIINQMINYSNIHKQDKKSKPVTLTTERKSFDAEVETYLLDEKYRAKFSDNICVFKQYLIKNNLQQNLAIRIIDKHSNKNNNLVQCLKDYLNVKHNSECIELIKAAYDPKLDKFHPIITKSFLEHVMAGYIDNYIYYSHHILEFLKYPNNRSSNDMYNEQILINIFKMTDLNPNMVIQNSRFLIREVAKCGYIDLLHLLLDKGIMIFSDKLQATSVIAPNKYLLLELQYNNSIFECNWGLSSYYESEKSHRYIVQYYKDKNNTDMVTKLEEIVPVIIVGSKKGAILKEMVVC